jgi:hypothetical protein
MSRLSGGMRAVPLLAATQPAKPKVSRFEQRLAAVTTAGTGGDTRPAPQPHITICGCNHIEPDFDETFLHCPLCKEPTALVPFEDEELLTAERVVDAVKADVNKAWERRVAGGVE